MKATTSRKSRLLYIDNLRIVLTVLVIMHHAAIAYGGPGGFYYVEKGQLSDVSEVLLTLMLAINQAFFMGFFFMISSYFSPGSIERKGAGNFLKDRYLRLGVPLLLFVLVIDPLLKFFTRRANGQTATLWQSLSAHYASFDNFGSGQLWFVAALLIFATGYVVIRRSVQVQPSADRPAPANARIAAFAMALGIVTFVVRIWAPVGMSFFPVLGFQLAHFPQYIALFALGIVAYQRNWFETLTAAQGKFWSRMVAVLIVLFPIFLVAGGALEGNVDAAFGGWHWQSFVYSVWEQFMCAAMVITLLVWFRGRFAGQGTLMKTMSRAAYATYVFHAPVIILVVLTLGRISFPDMGLKYIVVVPIIISIAFLVGTITKRLPVAKAIF